MADAPSLQQTLTKATDGLLFISESEHPFSFFEWADYTGKRLAGSAVLTLLNKPPDTPIEKQRLSDFFKPATDMQDWFGEEEKATVQQFEALKKTLTQQLTNIQVFRLGKVDIDIYIAGKTPQDHWAGLSTKVIET
ncbi:MAG: nuclease A inhibitor family protein [Bacteroidota bacterium]